MKYLFVAVTALFLVASCNTTKKATTAAAATTEAASSSEKSYVGEWDVTVEGTPSGTQKGILTITQTADGLGGTFSAGGGSLDLNKVTAGEDQLTVIFYYPDYGVNVDVKLKGAPSDDMLVGMALSEYRTTAVRKE